MDTENTHLIVLSLKELVPMQASAIKEAIINEIKFKLRTLSAKVFFLFSSKTFARRFDFKHVYSTLL